MAKKKKKNKSLLPKRIAGVKLPKAARKGRFAELLASKTGQALIAEAIMAAGAIAGAKKASDSPKARSFVHDAAEAVRDAGDSDKVDVGSAREVVAYAVGEAVRSFAEALRSGPGGERKTDEDLAERREGGADDGKKKFSSYEAGPL
jgi:hypothetical protein